MKTGDKGDKGVKSQEKKLMKTDAGMRPDMGKAISHLHMEQPKDTKDGGTRIGKPDMDCDY